MGWHASPSMTRRPRLQRFNGSRFQKGHSGNHDSISAAGMDQPTEILLRIFLRCGGVYRQAITVFSSGERQSFDQRQFHNVRQVVPRLHRQYGCERPCETCAQGPAMEVRDIARSAGDRLYTLDGVGMNLRSIFQCPGNCCHRKTKLCRDLPQIGSRIHCHRVCQSSVVRFFNTLPFPPEDWKWDG